MALNRRLDQRSSASLNAVYSTFTYSGLAAKSITPDIETRGINLSYQRLLTRTLSASVSAGPQWVNSSNSTPDSVRAQCGRHARACRIPADRPTHRCTILAESTVVPESCRVRYPTASGASLGHTFGRDWVASVSAAYYAYRRADTTDGDSWAPGPKKSTTPFLVAFR